MAGPARRGRRGQAQAAAALVLDSEGLSKAAAGDLLAVAWITRARELELPLVMNAVTLTETIRGGGRDARIHLLTKTAHGDTEDGAFATEAGQLLGRTRRSDTVDALVATAAMRLNQPTTILTSDPRDLADQRTSPRARRAHLRCRFGFLTGRDV